MENGVANIINATASNYSHSIYCISTSGASALKLTSEIPITEINRGNEAYVNFIYKMARNINQLKPDIVHTRTWGAIDGILAATLARTPIKIHSEHGWTADDPFGLNLKRVLFRRAIGTLFATHCIAVSPEIQNWLIKKVKINQNKVTTIINGVDTEKYKPDYNKNFKATLGLQPKDILIGTVGRLDPIKNHRLLVKAFAHLSSQNPNIFLLIIGNGPERQRLKNIISKLPCQDKIYLAGEKQDIHRILPSIDIFISSSFNEGISNTILEAMSSGVAIIASKVGGNINLIQHNSTGLLFESDNLVELIDSMKVYVEKHGIRKKHGGNARKSAISNFSLDRMTTEYSHLYNSLLKDHKR